MPMYTRRSLFGASESWVITLARRAAVLSKSVWLAGSIGLTAMPSTPLVSRSSMMRFWSLMPSTGMRVWASTPSFSPAAFTPAEAMVQNEATPLDTKAILRFLPAAGAEASPALPESAVSAGLLQAVSPSSRAVQTERERKRFMGFGELRFWGWRSGGSGAVQQTVMPPLTCRVWPVTKDEALLAR